MNIGKRGVVFVLILCISILVMQSVSASNPFPSPLNRDCGEGGQDLIRAENLPTGQELCVVNTNGDTVGCGIVNTCGVVAINMRGNAAGIYVLNNCGGNNCKFSYSSGGYCSANCVDAETGCTSPVCDGTNVCQGFRTCINPAEVSGPCEELRGDQKWNLRYRLSMQNVGNTESFYNSYTGDPAHMTGSVYGPSETGPFVLPNDFVGRSYTEIYADYLYEYTTYVMLKKDLSEPIPITWSCNDGCSLWIYDEADQFVKKYTRPNAEAGWQNANIELDHGKYKFVFYYYNGPGTGGLYAKYARGDADDYFAMMDSRGFGFLEEDTCELTCSNLLGYDWVEGTPNGCCGDDVEDNGFVTAEGTYACLFDEEVYLSDLSWIDASENAREYEIIEVNEPLVGRQTDFISNAEQWFYCDAYGSRDFGTSTYGKAVSNKQTFPSAAQDGNALCPGFPGEFVIINPDEPGETRECSAGFAELSGIPCCDYRATEYTPIPGMTTDYILDQCGWCYDVDGSKKNYLETGEGDYEYNEGVIPKDDVRNIDGRFSGNSLANCESPENRGDLCSEEQVCLAGYTISARDVLGENVCCYNEGRPGCWDEEIAETFTCADHGGFLLPSDPRFSCPEGDILPSEDTQICCRSQQDIIINDFILAGTEQDGFICYRDFEENTFAECCANDKCRNIDRLLTGQLDAVGLYSAGSSLFTVKSFDDKRRGVDRLIDLVGSFQLPSGNQDTPYYPLFSISQELQNWTSFDTLSLDFAYNGTVTLDSLYVVTATGAHRIPFAENTIKSSLNGNTWHHLQATIPTSLTGVTSIAISYQNAWPNTYFLIDNVELFSSTTALQTNYCSGDFRTWLDDLTPPATTDFTDFTTYGPYMFACNDRLSFGWTGEACCGARTTPSGEKEYYEDKTAGCWGGVTVDEDETVAHAIQNPNIHNNLLFHEGQFHLCLDGGDGAVDVSGIGLRKGSSNAISITAESDTAHSAFTVLGSHYCAPGGVWEKTDNTALTRLVAAKLYQHATEDVGSTSFTLHCGPKEETLVNAVENHVSQGEVTGNFCVLRYDDNVISGTSITNIRDFLTMINNTHSPFASHDQHSIDVTICDGIVANEDAFYQRCPDNNEYFTIYYDPQFNTVIFQQSDAHFLEVSFVENMWQGIVNFFSGIFGGPGPAEGPIPIPEDKASFSKLYIANEGGQDGLWIIALQEWDSPETPTVRYSYYEYKNFRDQETYDAVDEFFGNTPVTVFEGTHSKIYLTEDDYANEDPWTRLTSITRLVDSTGPALILELCGNGVIGWTEACDDGNVAEGDGCSDSCAVESGWNCEGEPSVCTQHACIGDIPEGATLCPGDDTGLTEDTPLVVVGSLACSDTAKCEYNCTNGLVPDGLTCVEPPACIVTGETCIKDSGCCSGYCGAFDTCVDEPELLCSGEYWSCSNTYCCPGLYCDRYNDEGELYSNPKCKPGEPEL